MHRRIALGLVALGACHDAPGPELASASVEIDKPFAFELAADGQPSRVWIDYDCNRADLPFAISLVIDDGKAQQKLETDTRRIRYGVSKKQTSGTEAQMGGMLFELAAHPAGTKLRVSGTLTQAQRQPDPPKCATLRIWAAR